MHKIKVVWICHFTNSDIRHKLPLLTNYQYTDFAPWISQMINQFKNFNDIELHIIAPHTGLKKNIFTFSDQNINYYFFRDPFVVSGSKFIQKWGSRINKLLFFKPNRYNFKKLLQKYIHFTPDIVNLIGFENPQYSNCVAEFKGIPVLISVQGIYSNPDRFIHEKENSIRSYLERSIIKKNKYYCIGASFFADLILRDRKDAIFFWNFFPRDIPLLKNSTKQKDYDFVFFSRISPVKGIEDLIDAMVIVKKVKPDVSLLVMGQEDPLFTLFIKEKIRKLALNNNIIFSGEQKTIEETHRLASTARYFVLPARIEGLAGSVLESMHMGLPVVTTNAGGLPYLNKDGETVLMSDPMDIPAFANNMIRLIQEPELTERLILAARTFVENEFDHISICRKFVDQYKAVIDHFQRGTDISPELLYLNKTINE